MITIKQGDLFDNAPKGAYLLHACNAQGVWGSGIARQFKKLYIESFKEYEAFCDDKTTGTCLITSENVVCLITSFNYGKAKDSPEIIIANTTAAVQQLMHQLTQSGATEVEIHSPKINSGLFEVPWEKTQAAIEAVLKKYPITVNWTVWEK